MNRLTNQDRSMRAAVVRAFGQPPSCGSFPEPTAGPGEVLVNVRAAGLHTLVKVLARGTHYASTGELPFVVGVDGVGHLEDGTRVYFGLPRQPFGTMAERSVVLREMCFPVPDGLDDTVVAALMNPGLSAWLALTWRAQLVPGETVLVLGATGVAGQLAVQLAKRLGAGRVIAAGRNKEVLSELREGGADATICLDQGDEELKNAIVREAGDSGIQVVVDYLWGHPTEVVISALTTQRRSGHSARVRANSGRIRLVEVGESAGATITLPAIALRGTNLTISGNGGGSVPADVLGQAVTDLLRQAAQGPLRIKVESVPLANVGEAWGRDPRGHRLVIVP